MALASDEAAVPGGPAEGYEDLLTELGDEDLPMLGETVAARLAAQAACSTATRSGSTPCRAFWAAPNGPT